MFSSCHMLQNRRVPISQECCVRHRVFGEGGVRIQTVNPLDAAQVLSPAALMIAALSMCPLPTRLHEESANLHPPCIVSCHGTGWKVIPGIDVSCDAGLAHPPARWGSSRDGRTLPRHDGQVEVNTNLASCRESEGNSSRWAESQ